MTNTTSCNRAKKVAWGRMSEEGDTGESNVVPSKSCYLKIASPLATKTSPVAPENRPVTWKCFSGSTPSTGARLPPSPLPVPLQSRIIAKFFHSKTPIRVSSVFDPWPMNSLLAVAARSPNVSRIQFAHVLRTWRILCRYHRIPAAVTCLWIHPHELTLGVSESTAVQLAPRKGMHNEPGIGIVRRKGPG
jgi:hypothetical protein